MACTSEEGCEQKHRCWEHYLDWVVQIVLSNATFEFVTIRCSMLFSCVIRTFSNHESVITQSHTAKTRTLPYWILPYRDQFPKKNWRICYIIGRFTIETDEYAPLFLAGFSVPCVAGINENPRPFGTIVTKNEALPEGRKEWSNWLLDYQQSKTTHSYMPLKLQPPCEQDRCCMKYKKPGGLK